MAKYNSTRIGNPKQYICPVANATQRLKKKKRNSAGSVARKNLAREVAWHFRSILLVSVNAIRKVPAFLGRGNGRKEAVPVTQRASRRRK